MTAANNPSVPPTTQNADDNRSLVVILKTTPQGMKNTEAFLKNRNWIVFSTHKIQEAVAFVMQKNPHYILIAADHPNKKVRKLPLFLKQSTDVNIVIFTEDLKNEVISAVQEMGSEYNLYPPVSGPSVERMLLKIRKNLEQQQLEANEKPVEIRKASSTGDQKQIALSELLSEENDAYEVSSSNKEAGPGIIIQKGVVGERINYSHHGRGSTEITITQEGSSHTTASALQKGIKAETHQSTQGESAAQKSRRLIFKGDENSVFVRGTQTALDETTQVLNPPGAVNQETVQPLEKTSNVACIAITSTRFSGYLVAAMGKNRSIDESFILMVQERLFAFLNKHGENVSAEDGPMNIKIEPIDFDEWSMRQAEFLRKSIHGNDEVAMAFFPSPVNQTQLEDSDSNEMCRITIDKISENAKLDFDLYIYLPHNEKYILHTPKDQVFNTEQKTRLKQKGITHIHLKKEAAADVKKYLAKSFLNGKIQQYKEDSSS
jgi:AmiR/NasT family two-component response regulator